MLWEWGGTCTTKPGAKDTSKGFQQDKTIQDKARQDKTRQDRTGKDKTGQHKVRGERRRGERRRGWGEMWRGDGTIFPPILKLFEK